MKRHRLRSLARRDGTARQSMIVGKIVDRGSLHLSAPEFAAESDSVLEEACFELSVPLPSQHLSRAVQGRHYSARRQLIKPLRVSSNPPSGPSIATGTIFDKATSGILIAALGRAMQPRHAAAPLPGGGRVIPSREGGDQLCYSTILTFAQRLPIPKNKSYSRNTFRRRRNDVVMQTLYCSASTIAKHIHPWIPIGTVTASIQ